MQLCKPNAEARICHPRLLRLRIASAAIEVYLGRRGQSLRSALTCVRVKHCSLPYACWRARHRGPFVSCTNYAVFSAERNVEVPLLLTSVSVRSASVRSSLQPLDLRIVEAGQTLNELLGAAATRGHRICLDSGSHDSDMRRIRRRESALSGGNTRASSDSISNTARRRLWLLMIPSR
jgi:hypothetical protein